MSCGSNTTSARAHLLLSNGEQQHIILCIRQSRQAFINSVRRHDREDGDGASQEGYVASLQLMLFGCIRAMEWTELKTTCDVHQR